MGKLKPDGVQAAMAAFRQVGINFACGLPDGWLLPLHEAVRETSDIEYVPVPHEGVGVSICVGAWLGGKKPVMLMENSGLRVATEALARLCMAGDIPILLLMPYRGDIGDTEYWAVPHGIVVEPLLNALRIPYTIVRDNAAQLQKQLVRAHDLSNASEYPVAVLVSGDLVW